MLAYSEWVGEERRWGEYRWQPLPYGNHPALGDCLGVLRTLEMMASSPSLEAALAERTTERQQDGAPADIMSVQDGNEHLIAGDTA
jgi:hypothetical protein